MRNRRVKIEVDCVLICIGLIIRLRKASTLAFRAVKAAALADNLPCNRRTTMVARFSLAAIYMILLLEIATLPIAVHKIAQAAAANFYGTMQHVTDFGYQSAALFGRHAVGTSGRQDAGGKQRFVSINIAHAHYDFVVHQRGFDGAFAA